jgi:hypothetical protein
MHRQLADVLKPHVAAERSRKVRGINGGTRERGEAVHPQEPDLNATTGVIRWKRRQVILYSDSGQHAAGALPGDAKRKQTPICYLTEQNPNSINRLSRVCSRARIRLEALLRAVNHVQDRTCSIGASTRAESAHRSRGARHRSRERNPRALPQRSRCAASRSLVGARRVRC